MFEPRLGVDLFSEQVVIEDPPVADDLERVVQVVGPGVKNNQGSYLRVIGPGAKNNQGSYMQMLKPMQILQAQNGTPYGYEKIEILILVIIY
jgi:hypothetical protein